MTDNAEQEEPKKQVLMKALTWVRESHGLFDYESSSIRKRDIRMLEGGKIFRIGENVDNYPLSQEQSELEEGSTPLFSIVKDDEEFKIRATGDPNDRLWRVI